MKKILVFTIAISLPLLAARIALARGFGGSHPEGGASHGSEGDRGGQYGGSRSSEGERGSSSGRSSEGERGGDYGGGRGSEGAGAQESGRNNKGSGEGAAAGHAAETNKNPQASGAQGAAAGAAAANRNQPTASGAQGAAAGAAAANRNQPAASGAQGAAAGAAAANRNQPAYSGAEGAAAGAAAANRNQPAYSGAQGAAAGAAVANRNQPAYSGAEGAAAGAAVANRNQPAYSGAAGAAAGYAAAGGPGGGYYPASLQGYQAAGPVGLPTDAGYGMSASGKTAAASHMTQAVNPNALVASGAAVRNANPAAGNFNQSWYGAHPDAWHAAGWAAGDSWHTASWNTLMPALGLVVEPIPYNYGSDVVYQGNQVYSNGQPVATSDEYYQQAAMLAQNAPPSNPQSSDWTPLGVFALVQNPQSDPHFIMQLAVNKSGALAGNYSDLISNTNQIVHGSVDNVSQRVAWTIGDNTSTVGETGLYNLTLDQAPCLIHIGKDKTQQWLLVRLNQPPQ